VNTKELAHALALVVAEAKLQSPYDIVAEAADGSSFSMRQSANGELEKTHESGPEGPLRFPVKLYLFDSTGRQKTIVLTDECAMCEEIIQ
jgi:hypothetical protein